MQGQSDLVRVKQQCNGMLRLDVYSALEAVAQQIDSGIVVEVGAAHGAATVTIARALAGRAAAVHVYAIERAAGGSRAAYGGFAENAAILADNLDRFGVTDRVTLLLDEVETAALAVPAGATIGLLLLDADGAIDRDFDLFFDRLAIGGMIVIDDCTDIVRSKRLNGDRLMIDQKHRLTFHLVEAYQQHGLIEAERQVYHTWFGRKIAERPKQQRSAEQATLDRAILAAYRRLTLSEAPCEQPRRRPLRTAKQTLKRWLRLGKDR